MDGTYGMVESFGIDNGELDGLSPAECFVLGYELAALKCAAESSGDEINRTIHAANLGRIEAALKKRQRQWLWLWPSDDKSEEWVYLKVHPKE